MCGLYVTACTLAKPVGPLYWRPYNTSVSLDMVTVNVRAGVFCCWAVCCGLCKFLLTLFCVGRFLVTFDVTVAYCLSHHLYKRKIVFQPTEPPGCKFIQAVLTRPTQYFMFCLLLVDLGQKVFVGDGGYFTEGFEDVV